MSTFPWHSWNGGPFSVERKPGNAPGTVIIAFRGSFTLRDAYGTSDPLALHKMMAVEPTPGEAPTVKSILDLTACPSMDSSGLGMVATYYIRCRKHGVKLVAAGLTPRVRELFKLTKMDSVIPIVATVEEAESR